MKLLTIAFMGILSSIFGSCDKPDFDKLAYENYNSSLAPEYRVRYTIEVSADKITYTSISANNEEFKETKQINPADFEKIKNKVYELKVIKCNSSDNCDGGGTSTVTGYKKGKAVFSNTHSGCNNECPGFYHLLEFLNSY